LRADPDRLLDDPDFCRVRHDLPQAASAASILTARASFQLMEADDVTRLQQWAAIWSDLVEFEIVPVAPSKDVTAMFNADAANG
jgi:hypothetical protein